MPDFSRLHRPWYWKTADMGGIEINIKALRELINAQDAITTTAGVAAITCLGVVLKPIGNDTRVTIQFSGVLSTQVQTDALTALVSPGGTYEYTPPGTGTMFEAFVTTSTTSFEDSWQAVDWDVQSFTNVDMFAHTAGASDITMKLAGNIIVVLRITGNNPTNGRCDMRTALFIDKGQGAGYVRVPGTTAYSYHRTSATGKASCSLHKAIAVTNGDKLEVRVIRNSGSAVMSLVSEACCIYVARKD